MILLWDNANIICMGYDNKLKELFVGLMLISQVRIQLNQIQLIECTNNDSNINDNNNDN